MKDCMQEMGKEFQESIVYKARPEQIKHQVKQLLDGERKGKGSTKEATHSNWNPPSKVNICPVGSSVVGIVASPAVGLRAFLKRRLPQECLLRRPQVLCVGKSRKRRKLRRNLVMEMRRFDKIRLVVLWSRTSSVAASGI